jgi:hypothetical protein
MQTGRIGLSQLYLPGTRAFLAQFADMKAFRHQTFADTKALLTLEAFWYESFADTKALLTPELIRHRIQ